MNKIKVIVLFFLFLNLYSCTDELKISDANVTEYENISHKQKVKGDGNHDVLGYGCDVTTDYMDPTTHHNSKVIDVERLFIEQPGSFYTGYINSSNAYITDGSDALDWSAKFSNKIEGDVTVGLITGGMNLEVIYSDIFSQKRSYATLNLYKPVKNERLNHSKVILQNYLTSNFVTALNTLSVDDIIKEYGTHVFTDVILGGRLEVSYSSVTNSSTKTLTVNAGVSAKVDKVFSVKATNSADLSYKTTNTNESCKFRTIGGDANYSMAGIISDASSSLKLNLDAWTASVKLTNSNVIDIGDNTLVPIYDFVANPSKKAELKAAVEKYLNAKRLKLANGSVKCEFSLTHVSDKAITLDYNGDKIMDILFYSPGYGTVCLNGGLTDGTYVNIFFNSNGLNGNNFMRPREKIISLDYNGDGKDDLLTYCPGTGAVSLHKSNGDGSFDCVKSYTTGIGGFDLGCTRDVVLSFDYNGDHLSDIMLCRPGNKVVYIAKSDGKGEFTNVLASHNGIGTYDFASNNDKAVALDYNGDGLDDIMTFRTGYGVVFIHKSDGQGKFNQSGEKVYESRNGIGGFDLGSIYDQITALDFNGDGKDDIICYRPGMGYFYAIISNGNGQFSLPTGAISKSGMAGFSLLHIDDRIIASDYNSDKKSDIILLSPGYNKVTSAHSNGYGFFEKDYAD